eukprot:4933238-Pyramimonas_sp.AAC.1
MKVLVDFPGWPTISLFPVYFKSAAGPSEFNIDLMAKLGRAVSDPAHSVIAGDWNQTPDVVESSGFPRKLGMLPVAPTAPTCRSPTSSSIIDCFALGAGVARLISG